LSCYHWTSFEEKKLNAVANQEQLSDVVNPLYGLDPKGIRDWNEEYQVVKDFPKDNIAQRAQRDRAIQKIYNDFLEAATLGAIAIVKGNLTPLNPNETQNAQVFVYNYIFFSFTVDLMDSFADLTSAENNPSWTQANHDMTGLKSLQFLEIDNLHYLATTIVNYKGQRILA
jgi:protein TIF31